MAEGVLGAMVRVWASNLTTGHMNLGCGGERLMLQPAADSPVSNLTASSSG